MPVTIQLTGLKYKNSQGQFQSADCLKGEDADISIIAPDYSELTFPVNAGKLCTHDLKLYRAKQGIPTSENWTESHWDERTIEEELAAKYTKPAGGIPASDLADGVIPDIIDDEAGAGDTDVTFSADKLTADHTAVMNALSKSKENTNIAISPHPVGDLFWYNGTLHVATSAIAVGDTIVDTGTGANCKDTTISEAMIRDIQINGTSILQNGVANIPKATGNTLGLVIPKSGWGISVDSQGQLGVNIAVDSEIKGGTNGGKPIVPVNQHKSSFYGLAKAAGADMKDIASTTVGQYPETQKSAISQMLNGAVQVTGTTPVITAKSGIRYICGECATLDITAPESGDIEVIFDSGSTATVLTVTPPTGVPAIKWANGFDPTALDANTRYDLIITDGEWGLAASWGA